MNKKPLKSYIELKKKEFDMKLEGSMLLEDALKATNIKAWKHPEYSSQSPHAFVELFYRFLLKSLL